MKFSRHLHKCISDKQERKSHDLSLKALKLNLAASSIIFWDWIWFFNHQKEKEENVVDLSYNGNGRKISGENEAKISSSGNNF